MEEFTFFLRRPADLGDCECTGVEHVLGMGRIRDQLTPEIALKAENMVVHKTYTSKRAFNASSVERSISSPVSGKRPFSAKYCAMRAAAAINVL